MAESYCNSYYAATANPTAEFERLEGSVDVDVAIVGGGFTGIATALGLAERGVRVAVLEANVVGWGASSRNGGQITGSLSGDRAMEKQFQRVLGKEAAEFVWNLRWRGHEVIKMRVERYGIQCDLKHGHMHAAYKTSHVAELEQMYQAACAHGMGDEVEMLYGADVRNVVGTDIYQAGLINRRNMHVHSLNLCLGEADAARRLGARIFAGSKVTSIRYGRRPELFTEKGHVRADKVLLAGNTHNKLARFKLGGLLFPASLGIVTTDPLPADLAKEINPQDLAVYDTRFVLDYYRLTADRRLLFGSGTNYTGNETRDIASVLRRAIEKTFPQLKGIGISFAWQGQDGITINRIPQLGQVTPNVYYAQGYSGHGVATSHVVSEIMASALCDDDREFRIFQSAKHWRLPVGRFLGNQALAVGMWYFQQLEKMR